MLACQSGYLKVADLLLKKGANASVINKVSYIYAYIPIKYSYKCAA